MTQADSSAQLAEIGNRLSRRAVAARRRGVRGAGIDTLHLLADELRGDGHALAGCDLVTAYPPAVLLPDLANSSFGRAVRWLEVIRDVLVFAPVALTWWQLRNALTAYQHAPEGTSFLLGWQQGFDGATWSLGTSALLVALVVGVVIALTLCVHLVEAGDERIRSLRRERDELGQDLTHATALLARQEHTQVDRLPVRELSKVGSRITAATKHMVTALDEARTDITRAVATGPGSGLGAALAEWTSAAKELRRVSESWETPAETLTALSKLHEAVVADGERMRRGLDALVEQLNVAATAHQAEAQSNRVVASEVTRSVDLLGESLEAFTAHAESLSQLVSQLRYALDRLDDGYQVFPQETAGIGTAEPSDQR
jgi:hypothetical protein